MPQLGDLACDLRGFLLYRHWYLLRDWPSPL